MLVSVNEVIIINFSLVVMYFPQITRNLSIHSVYFSLVTLKVFCNTLKHGFHFKNCSMRNLKTYMYCIVFTYLLIFQVQFCKKLFKGYIELLQFI